MHATRNPAIEDPHGTPADTLRYAAAYLDMYGWIQDGFYHGSEPFPAADIAGAVRMAVYGHRNDNIVLDSPLGWHVDMALCALADFLGIADTDQSLLAWVANASDQVTAWNDEPGRTRPEVLDALYAAADDYDTSRTATTGGTR